MITFGIIGTSWISRSFLDATYLIDDVKFTNLYSRTVDKAQQFLIDGEQDVKIDTDLDIFFKNDFDFVYVASPNSLHFSHAKQALENNKNVFLEKPFALNIEDANELFTLAKSKNLLILEAITSLTKPNLATCKNILANDFGDIKKVSFSFCQYSSKLEDFKQGKVANSLNPEFGGGVVTDLGVYPLHLSLALFGKPAQYKVSRILTNDKYDLNAHIFLDYGNFFATGSISKEFSEDQYFKVVSDKHKLEILSCGQVSKVLLDGEDISDSKQEKVNMYYETKEFVNCLLNKQIESNIMTKEQTCNIVEIIENK